MRTLNLFLTSVLAFGIIACEKDDDKKTVSQIEELTVSNDFDYETLQDVHLTATVKNKDGQIVRGAKVFVYEGAADGSLNASNPIITGFTNASGVFESYFQLPKHLTKVVVQAGIMGTVNQMEVDITSELNVNLGGILVEPARPKKGSSELFGTNATYLTLGSWNSNGVPTYLEPANDVISQGLLDDVNASLPEGLHLPLSHPEYISTSNQTNLALDDSSEVWVTFIHEGAGYRNILGYYYYPTNNPPADKNAINNLTIIFPNSSYVGSGGGLVSGNKVRLKHNGSNVFPAGTTVGWFIAANGFVSASNLTEGVSLYYSNQDFNPESQANWRQHNVLLIDNARQLLLLSFEDLNRTNNGGDEDFNDAIFFAKATPWSSVNQTDIPPITISDTTDTDNDGVRDDVDEYPTDPERAANNYFPSKTIYGSLAFEDRWPNKGDYDFNDVVLRYRFNQVTNASNQVVDVKANFVVKASGAAFGNGFGFEMPILPSDVASVTGKSLFNPSFTGFDANGVEAGQTKAVVIVTDDVKKMYTPASSYQYLNTEPGSPAVAVTPDTINIVVNLVNPVSTSVLNAPPYNPFLIVNRIREKEIHLPGKTPTTLANLSLFGTGDDTSNPGEGRYYKTSNNLPWALILPTNWLHVEEKEEVILGYPNFIPWAESGGVSNTNWYVTTIPGNTNSAYIWAPNTP